MKLPESSRKCKVYSAQSKQKTLHYSLITDHFKEKRGFSLIELLIVISIIGILVATATVSWTNAQQKSRDSKRKSDVKSIQQALELYLQDNGTYPQNDASGLIQCPGSPPVNIAWGGNFTCNSKTYMNPLPKDPRGGSDASLTFAYDYHVDSTTGYLKYQLNAALENSKDPEYCTDSSTCAQLPCAPNAPGKSSGSKSYCVINP